MSFKSFLANPDNTEATIVMTLPLREWKAVREALKDSGADGPWQVNRMITELVTKMEEKFYATNNMD